MKTKTSYAQCLGAAGPEGEGGEHMFPHQPQRNRPPPLGQRDFPLEGKRAPSLCPCWGGGGDTPQLRIRGSGLKSHSKAKKGRKEISGVKCVPGMHRAPHLAEHQEIWNKGREGGTFTHTFCPLREPRLPERTKASGPVILRERKPVPKCKARQV